MKTLTTLILAFIVSTCSAQVDTIKVNYFEVLNMDSTVYNPEEFFNKLEIHYTPLGEIEEMSCVIGEQYYDVRKICIRFKSNPYRWVVYTPQQIENKLEKK
jgi:hypothetical protein